ncbi:hypothetical protein [Celeribacter persicus]|jgi:hypothetical protein|uniref:Uncharacterized protein n=1 Tax=Celeribacter persicus TaxID=1651082 RepID=A0A2T5HF89_9RHOB|nr:hypothetical protein [Celeribacter persicus]PTQ70240.1 hypothetical protein C8N42_110126 [Celeribacter persicus]
MAQNESYNQSSGGNGGLYFILGAIVVVLGVILYVIMGGDATPVVSDAPDGASVTINNDAPDNGGSLNVTTEESAPEAPASE